MFRSELFSHEGRGFLSYGSESIPGQQLMGQVHFNGTKITGPASFLGDVSAENNAEFDSVQITGKFKVNDKALIRKDFLATGQINTKGALFESTLTATGDVRMQDTTINGEINLISGKVELSDSVVKKSISFNDDGRGLPPKLILKNTVIHGDVTFKGSNGIVEMDKASRIEGSLVGAKIADQAEAACAGPKL